MPNGNLTAEPGKHEIIMTSVIEAPVELIFKTFTDPALIPQWWGPRYLTTVVDRMEVKPGGIWRYVQRDPEGNEFGFHGVYHSIEALRQLVYTFEFEGMPGHVLLETVTFENQGDKTRIIDQLVFQSVEDRDGMLNSGMESGSNESMERLSELVQKALAG